MINLTYLIVLILVVAQIGLPRRYAVLPLIFAGCQLGNIEILPQLTPARILILIGLVRALAGGFLYYSAKNKLDNLFILFSAAAILSSFAHQADEWVPSPLNARVGLVLNVAGAYLYGRAYVSDLSALQRYAMLLILALVPLAIGMTIEKKISKNVYYVLGASRESVILRDGKVRAVGPFRHPILAGTAGATALPFALLLWRLGRKKLAALGVCCCTAIVLSSASSGPAAAMGLVLFSVSILWRWRNLLRQFLWGCVAVALIYSLISLKAPWFIMAKIDLAGGSTGWFRAQLLDQGLRHLDEWWLLGTDYTRHWMPTGVTFSPKHTDLTNYYLHLGVLGGLPLLLCLIAMLKSSFSILALKSGDVYRQNNLDEFTLWCVGTSLAAHAISFISISYFDQMYVFFYVLLGAIPGLITSVPSSLAGVPSMPSAPEPIPRRVLRYYS